MTCLIAITVEELRESVSSVEKVQTRTKQPEMSVWFLNPPGLPLSVVAAAMNQARPKTPIVILSDSPQFSEEAFQTVDAVGTVSDEPPFPILQPFLEPIPFVRTKHKSEPREKLGHNPSRVLEDLKSAVDTLHPAVRRRVIAEIHTVLEELNDAA